MHIQNVRGKGFVVAFLVSVLGIMALAQPVLAANTSVSPLWGAGVNQQADFAWADQTFTCNKWVVPGSAAGGNGSQLTPWVTLKYAFSQVQAGDDVCVANGTYVENHLIPGVSGTAQAPITFTGGPGVVLNPNTALSDYKQPVIDFDPAGSASLAYWRIDGFNMDRQQQDGVGVRLQGLSSSGAGTHHIALLNSKVQNSKGSSGVLMRGQVRNILLRKNSFLNNARWVNAGNSSDIRYTEVSSSYDRFDSNGVSIEGTDRGVGQLSVDRVRIDDNTFDNNGGDGVQCLGVNDQQGAKDGDPSNIDLVDNKVKNNVNSGPHENAFDIKSCQHVSIRGREIPGGAADGSKVSNYSATAQAADYGGGNNDNGTAILVHYAARDVLIEYNRIWNACSGIVIGRTDMAVQDVVVRRNLMFDMRYQQAYQSPFTTPTVQDKDRCKGTGITLNRANNVDIYHNTIDGIPRDAVRLGYDVNATGPAGVDIWNNIFKLSNTVGAEKRYWISLVAGTNINSNYNIFWHDGGTALGDQHFRIGSANLSLATWRQNRDLTLPTVWADPLFVANPLANDYYTQPTSPARDTALHNLGLAYCGAKPDIGFLESCN